METSRNTRSGRVCSSLSSPSSPFAAVSTIADRYLHVKTRDGTYHRMVYKVTTDNGIVGWGDYDWGGLPPPRDRLEPHIGKDPFDYLNTNVEEGLGMALYDIMGKYLDKPVHALLGQKVRDGAQVAAWSWGGPTAKEFQADVARAVKQGYMIFKIHTNALEDLFEWTKAAEEVTPPGFKLHYDFTGRPRRPKTLAALLPIINELERKHPIVQWLEDPMDKTDVTSWRELRNRTKLTVVHGGGAAMGGMQEVIHGMADAYMIGGPVGTMMSEGHAYGRANIQVLIQFCGGTLAKAMALHVAAVLPTASGHMINLDDQCDVDITTKRIPVHEGFSPVPDGPGLGFEVDEKALARISANKPREAPRYVGVLKLAGGHTVYSLGQTNIVGIAGNEVNGVIGQKYSRWIDDGSPEFEKAYDRVKNDGYFIEVTKV